MSKPAKPRVFIETSIQIARILTEKHTREGIEKAVSQPDIEFVTNHYVFMEYQRSLIADFAYVHWAFQQAQTPGAALRLVFGGSRSYRARSLMRCGQIASLAYGEREVIQLSDATALLELYLQLLLKRTFWRHVTALPDFIHCDLIALGTNRQPDNHYIVADSCRKETAACHLPDFLTEQRSRINLIADYLARHTNAIKDQSRVERLLASIQADPRNALGQTTCWPLGDIIILLQVPSDCAVWTLDPDFAPLAKALELALYTPSSNNQEQ